MLCSKVSLVLDAEIMAKVRPVLVYKIHHGVRAASENGVLLV